MEERIFYGKTISPKVIAEASLAYSFSFDLQRFDNETGWSIGVSDTLKDKLVYMYSGQAIASLVSNDTNKSWSLSGGNNSATIELDFNGTTGSVKGSDISGSLSGSHTIFDASNLASSFKFTLGSNAQLTSIVGSSTKENTIIGGSGAKVYIGGGSGADYLEAGTAGASLYGGGGGADSLVGSSGKDFFIYGSTDSTDSIFGYTEGEVISLSADPGIKGIGTISNALVIGYASNNSLFVKDMQGSTVTALFNGKTYKYNRDYVQLDNNVSLTPDVDKFTAFNTDSIDATGVTHTGGVWINSYGNTVIGSNTKGTSVFGGAGNDFVSLAGSKKDVFIYGGGNDTIQGIGAASSFVSLGTKYYKTPITDGTALSSLSAGVFKLTFDKNNSLTFKDAKAAVSITSYDDKSTLAYTPTAISIAGAGNGSSITLGSSYDSSSFAGTGYSVISAAAASVSNGSFAVSGGHTSNLIWGSDKQVTSILGGSGADTLYAGTEGASLVGNGGNDLLVGGSGTDYFIYGHNTTGAGGNVTIRNYTYGTDFVSLGGAAYPTTNIENINLQSGKSNFHISLGSNAADSVLTFESATKVDLVSVGSGNHDTLFHYEADKIIVDDNRITLGAAYKSNFNANANTWTNSNYKLSSIDASHVTVSNGINITGFADSGNSIIGAKFGGKIVGSESSDYLQSGVAANNSTVTTTIDAGEAGNNANDTLVGGTGSDWFIYRGAKASIGSYTSKADSIQIVGFNMVGDDVPTFASMPTASEDLVLTFGTGSSLSIAGGATEQSVVTFKNGSHIFEYSAGTVSLDNKSVTLTADYNPENHYIAQGTIATVNAEAVASGVVSLRANNDYNTRLIGSTNQRNSLVSGDKNDYLVGGNAADVFEYTGGKDTVSGYQYKASVSGSVVTDSLVAGDFVNNIKSGRVSGSRLIFTGNEKGNVLTFLSEDDAIEKVSLGGGGYLTKDAYVKTGNGNDSLKFFSSARGTIELTNSLYKVSDANAIATVDASAVKQSVTLVADSLSTESVYILPGNKKKDRFEYAGGKVSISGYETGKDQLNLGIGTISGFTVKNDNVLISLNSSSANVVSVSGGKALNFLVHQSSNGNNVYRKMAFTKSGILTDKASKPTTVTVLGGAHSLNANEFDGGTIKRIYAASGDVGNISITASDKNNTLINMGVAGSGVSIYGGKKNDKITGSETDGDLFVYRTDDGVGGKDVITNFGDGDKISLGANPVASLNGANITARNKGVTFKFAGNKNSLNLKSADDITAVTVAGDTADTVYTFKKNAFSANGGTNVSLTSGFAGNFNINKTKVGDNAATNVNGSNVTRNLTFTGTSSGETLVGGKKKTTFKAAGGQDSLVGGSGKDIFFYAKGDAGTTTIVDFDYTNDKIKLASGTLAKIETIDAGVRLAMKDNSGNNVGWYQITGSMSYNKDGSKKTADTDNKPSAKTVFKANNTYYWFAPEKITEEVTVEGSGKQTVTLASAGQLVTTDTRVSASKVSDYDVIELNYSTNLVRAGIAVATSKATLPTKSS